MEKTAEELFNEAIEYRKEANEAHNHLDEVGREIIRRRNAIDKLRTSIRNLEEEEMKWKQVIRVKNCLANERDRQGWAVRRAG
jgi:uncharacterized coiled-coil DUF342 family protein